MPFNSLFNPGACFGGGGSVPNMQGGQAAFLRDSYPMEGGRNPYPSYAGQCIIGENGYPLVAARVYNGARRGSVQWKYAPVECGLAMDGGLQEIVLNAALASTINTVYVSKELYDNKPHLNALETALKSIPGRHFQVLNMDTSVPTPGAVIVHLATEADKTNGIFVPSSPTRTQEYFEVAKALGVPVDPITSHWPYLTQPDKLIEVKLESQPRYFPTYPSRSIKEEGYY